MPPWRASDRCTSVASIELVYRCGLTWGWSRQQAGLSERGYAASITRLLLLNPAVSRTQDALFEGSPTSAERIAGT